MHRSSRRGLLSVAGVLISILAVPLGAAVPEKQADGIIVPINGAFLKVEVYAEDIIHVAFAKDRSFFEHKSLSAEPRRGPAPTGNLGQDRPKPLSRQQSSRCASTSRPAPSIF